MAQQVIQGNEKLAKKIKYRRNELNLTIEEAAKRAGVSTKTWSRYEAGESIRNDKCKGICKALNWREFLKNENKENKKPLIEEYKSHEAWSPYLADNYGYRVAAAFAAGSDILLDKIKQDLSDLTPMPFGSHISQLSMSFINDVLPTQFLMRYDYDFLYKMKCTLLQFRMNAATGIPMVAHSVMEELIIYLCNEESMALVTLSVGVDELSNDEEFEDSNEWVFDMFGDMDIITFLYSNKYLDEDHPFHFVHWNELQFYMPPEK